MFLFKRKRKKKDGGGQAPSTGAPGQSTDGSAAEACQRELQLLRVEVARLRQQLAAVGAVRSDYLYRYRSVALPLLGPEWELRYFVLLGSAIRVYKTSKDVVFNPREEISMLGCSVEWQGRQGARLWVWSVVDPSGSVLLRAGSPSELTALKWVQALEDVGCVRRPTVEGALFGLAAHQHSMILSGVPLQRMSGPEVLRGNSLNVPIPSSVGAVPPLTLPVAAATTAHGANLATPSAAPPADASGITVTAGGPSTPAQVHSAAGVSDAGAGGAFPAPTSPADAAQDAGDGADVLVAQQAERFWCKSVELPKGVGAGTSGTGSSGGVGGPAAAAVHHHQSMLPSSPVHCDSRSSLLSSDRLWHEKHTGLYNLMGVILISTNFRLALENALKYGWRYNPIKGLRDLTIGNPNIPLALCYPLLLCLAALSLLLEQVAHVLLRSELQLSSALAKKEGLDPHAMSRALAARRSLHEWVLFFFSAALTSATLGLPWYVIQATAAEPLSSGVLIILAVIMWMKLISFHHCCADLRQARRAGDLRPGERGSPSSPHEWVRLAYPENLTTGHLAYFLAAPTLTYQVNYPRTDRIRWKWLARRLAELAVMLTVMSLIVQQYMVPTIANSMRPLKQMNWLHLCERLLKLALPNTYCWLAMFYSLFHVWLNVLAELLRFGDRVFYRDWWNAPTLGEYWKLWNMPVHKWLLRHVYFPAIRMGLSQMQAMVVVFLVSAAAHELVCGVPLHCVGLRFWAFSGIMLQVPMIMLTDHIRRLLKRDEAGNIVFWLTFCVLGQPICILLYAHDFFFTAACGHPPPVATSGIGLVSNFTATAI